MLGGKPRRHAFERRPHRDHVEDLGLGLAHDEDAAARNDPDQALLVELRQRLAQRRAADAEALRQIALVEPQLGIVGVDVHVHDGGLERLVGARLQAQAFADRARSSAGCRPRRTSIRAIGARSAWFLVYHTPRAGVAGKRRVDGATLLDTIARLSSRRNRRCDQRRPARSLQCRIALILQLAHGIPDVPRKHEPSRPVSGRRSSRSAARGNDRKGEG